MSHATPITTSGVEVRDSRIHRRGVYALRAFRAGEIVLRWDTSQRVPRDQPPRDGEHRHPFDAGTNFVVQSPECFVNHCCAHNTEVIAFCDVAVRAIAPGDEITSNYETDGAGLGFDCRCGADSCRGRIGVPMAQVSP